MDDSDEGRFASFYDLFFDGLLAPIRKKNLELICDHGCKKIIDLGCGTGSQCRALSDNGLELVGIDSSENMLKVAKKKNRDKTTFVFGDITNNGYADGSFDCAIITLVLHPNSQESIKRIINEARRLTTGQGIVLITDYDAGKGMMGRLAAGIIWIVESLAKKTHRTNYFLFMENRGVEEILSKEDHRVCESISFYGGALKTCIVK